MKEEQRGPCLWPRWNHRDQTGSWTWNSWSTPVSSDVGSGGRGRWPLMMEKQMRLCEAGLGSAGRGPGTEGERAADSRRSAVRPIRGASAARTTGGSRRHSYRGSQTAKGPASCQPKSESSHSSWVWPSRAGCFTAGRNQPCSKHCFAPPEKTKV